MATRNQSKLTTNQSN